MAKALTHVVIYTDGACSPNPGKGGWGVVLIAPDLDKRKELSGAEPDTTNNRMEMMAVIEGLQALKMKCRVDLYTDSTYVMNAFKQGWLKKWRRNGWRTSDKSPVKNDDLWRQMSALIDEHDVTWHWVKGHAGDPENERADALAVSARLELVE